MNHDGSRARVRRRVACTLLLKQLGVELLERLQPLAQMLDLDVPFSDLTHLTLTQLALLSACAACPRVAPGSDAPENTRPASEECLAQDASYPCAFVYSSRESRTLSISLCWSNRVGCSTTI